MAQQLPPHAQEQAQTEDQDPPRKIGYVARRLDDLKSDADARPKTDAVPYMITDWASI